MVAAEHPKQRGQKSEAIVLSELVNYDLTVLSPFGDNERYDFVVEAQGTFHRVQVKTGREENGRVQFETRSSAASMTSISKKNYEDDIDVFVVYSPDYDRLYAVPIEKTPKTMMGLREEIPEKSSPNINDADDYRLENWVASVS